MDFNSIFKGGTTELKGGVSGLNNVLTIITLVVTLFSAQIMQSGFPPEVAIAATQVFLDKYLDEIYKPIADAITFKETEQINQDKNKRSFIWDGSNFNESYQKGFVSWNGVDFMNKESQMMSQLIPYGQAETKGTWKAEYLSGNEVVHINTKDQYDAILNNVIKNGRSLHSLFKNVYYHFKNDGKIVQFELLLPDNTGSLLITRDTNLPQKEVVINVLNEAASSNKEFQKLLGYGNVPKLIQNRRQSQANSLVILPELLNSNSAENSFKSAQSILSGIGTLYAGIETVNKFYQMYQKHILTQLYRNYKKYNKFFKSQFQNAKQTLQDIAQKTILNPPQAGIFDTLPITTPITTARNISQSTRNDELPVIVLQNTSHDNGAGTGLFGPQLPPMASPERFSEKQKESADKTEDMLISPQMLVSPMLVSPMLDQPYHVLKKKRKSSKRKVLKKGSQKRRKSVRRKSKSPQRKSPYIKLISDARKLLKSSSVKRSRSRPRVLSSKRSLGAKQVSAARKLIKNRKN